MSRHVRGQLIVDTFRKTLFNLRGTGKKGIGASLYVESYLPIKKVKKKKKKKIIL